jgi:hypothetical protein
MAEHRGSPPLLTHPRSTIPPEPLSVPTPQDLRRLRELLEAVVADRSVLATLPEEERRRLLVAVGRMVHPETDQKRRLVKAFRKAKRRRVEAHDRSLLAGTGIRAAREREVFVPPPPLLPPGPDGERPRELLEPRACYVCKAEYRRLHFFYDALCPSCAELNYGKRFQTADLRGRVALVTGARVKIGYQSALKLLRAGATVVATTRFPHDAARRYAAEADFAEWGSRLRIHGLDLRHSPSVEILCRQLGREFPHLDLLVNDACQTVRRPPGCYAHLLDFEERPIGSLAPQLPAPAGGPACRELVAAHALRSLGPRDDRGPARQRRRPFHPVGAAEAAPAAHAGARQSTS